MEWKTSDYDFASELAERADEREESMLRGVSQEPLLVREPDLELMDGYTRYTVLRRHSQTMTYVYLARLHSRVGRAGYPAPPPSDPSERISRTRLLR